LAVAVLHSENILSNSAAPNGYSRKSLIIGQNSLETLSFIGEIARINEEKP